MRLKKMVNLCLLAYWKSEVKKKNKKKMTEILNAFDFLFVCFSLFFIWELAK